MKEDSGTTKTSSFTAKLRKGAYNEEISCALGLIFLIAAFAVSKVLGSDWKANTLYLGAYIFAGQEGLKSAISSLREKVLDIDVLMVLAALGAALVGAPFEGALLLFLFSFSNVLQRYAMDRTNMAIRSLLDLSPELAFVKRDGGIREVPVEELDRGETVIVKPGEHIPVDGEVSEGSTHIDEASLTGESMPVKKSVGSPVFAGTINQTGSIELTVTKLSGDSTLARMIKLVAEAKEEKSKTQSFLENAERKYVLGVVLVTLAVFLVPWLTMGEDAASAFYRAMTVMVVASPCALVISTPASVLSAIGGAARRGILIKGGSHLERAATIDMVAVDKTGTLTVGKPSLTAIVTVDGALPVDETLSADAKNYLRLASALEARSEHPLAHAITSAAKKLGVPFPEAMRFQAITGKGAQATVEDKEYFIGSERWIREIGATCVDELAIHAQPLQEMGRTCVWMAVRRDEEFRALCVMVMGDTVRPEARDLIEQLRKAGVKSIAMLTGDHHLVANAIGGEVGIDEIHAELLPEDKLRIIREFKERGNVMMVGDGVNDAPALAASDLSVAMGAAGTDVAMETADVVLMGDRLENLPLLLRHSRRARRILVQNLVFSSLVIIILVAAALGFSLPLPVGVVGHEGSTVLVCLNGLRLLMISRS